MCECEKRIEELKKLFIIALNTIHDTIVDTTDESKEWYAMFIDEIDTLNANIETI